MSDQGKYYFTTTEAAGMLDLSPSQLRRLVKATPRLKIKREGRYRFTSDQIEQIKKLIVAKVREKYREAPAVPCQGIDYFTTKDLVARTGLSTQTVLKMARSFKLDRSQKPLRFTPDQAELIIKQALATRTERWERDRRHQRKVSPW